MAISVCSCTAPQKENTRDTQCRLYAQFGTPPRFHMPRCQNIWHWLWIQRWNSDLRFRSGIRVSGGIETHRLLESGENSVCREFVLERLGWTWGRFTSPTSSITKYKSSSCNPLLLSSSKKNQITMSPGMDANCLDTINHNQQPCRLLE
jgi:hypothetical protein